MQTLIIYGWIKNSYLIFCRTTYVHHMSIHAKKNVIWQLQLAIIINCEEFGTHQLLPNLWWKPNHFWYLLSIKISNILLHIMRSRYNVKSTFKRCYTLYSFFTSYYGLFRLDLFHSNIPYHFTSEMVVMQYLFFNNKSRIFFIRDNDF